MNLVTCPHCGQMQALASDGKCIKCKKEVSGSGQGFLLKSGPLRKCPYCGNIQNGGDVCEKCKKSMRQPLKISIFSVGVLIFFLFLLALAFYIFIKEGTIDTSLLILVSFPTLLFGGMACVSIYGSFERVGKFIEGDALKDVQRQSMPHEFFTFSYGIDGIKNGSACTVYADTNSKNIIFKDTENRERMLPFSQVLDIRIVGNEREVNKSVIGRAAVGSAVAGPVGAIVGGISGQGVKTVKDPEVFEIDYRRRDGANIQTISLRIGKVAPHGFKDALRIAVGLDLSASEKKEYTKGKSDYL